MRRKKEKQSVNASLSIESDCCKSGLTIETTLMHYRIFNYFRVVGKNTFLWYGLRVQCSVFHVYVHCSLLGVQCSEFSVPCPLFRLCMELLKIDKRKLQFWQGPTSHPYCSLLPLNFPAGVNTYSIIIINSGLTMTISVLCI